MNNERRYLILTTVLHMLLERADLQDLETPPEEYIKFLNKLGLEGDRLIRHTPIFKAIQEVCGAIAAIDLPEDSGPKLMAEAVLLSEADPDRL
ncbi:hypothetical protein [Paenibacillus xylanexedens]|uniref:hypothetical protein n=1 Tax=Paenibacillus xylanexedens TaxID=528191 RepID=UPI00119EACE2|nr:hypothetical protein [Paenibacillus xylanexedens]